MAQDLDSNPYSPPTSDADCLPEASTPYRFVPNVLWFVPGAACGFMAAMVIIDGLPTLFASLQREPLDTLVFFLCFGAICLLVSCVWRMMRHRSNFNSRPTFLARFLGGLIMGFGGIGIVRTMEMLKILGRPSFGGWIIVIGIFALCSIVAVEVEAILGRRAFLKAKNSGASVLN